MSTVYSHPIADVRRAKLYKIMVISFGPDWQRELWASPYWLRFELNQGGSPVNMFTSAYDRARSLARAALPSQQVVAVIAGHPDPSLIAGASQLGWNGRAAFDILGEMGVPTTSPEAIWAGYTYPDDEEDPEAHHWDHRAASITWDQADILLWNQIAQDMPVTPQAPVVSKLVDVARGVTVYAYDDRGMDITALSREPIAELYTRFDAWLLDYDRSRMSQVFAA